MARKIFKRTGIRRDKNFADVGDSKAALNNLLDTLVDDSSSTFISEDLDPIRTIFTTGITNAEYRQFIGSSVKETSVDGSTDAVQPAITYQNRLDNFRVTSGEPRLNGGNGLTASYFNQDQVEDTKDIFTGITTGGKIPSDTFWEAGQFAYTRKIHPQSVSAAGGVEWEGFFIPTQTGVYNFNTSSTLAFTVDFEQSAFSQPSDTGIAGQFVSATNASTDNGDVTILRTNNQTGVLTLANITDGTSATFTFSDAVTSIPTSAFTAGKQYRIQVSENLDLRFIMNAGGGGTGGGIGGKLDATVRIESGKQYTLIVGVVGAANQSRTLIQGAGGTGSSGGFAGGGFTGLFETTTITANALFDNVILITGGGGGSGANVDGGGAGGGTTGGTGAGLSGGGGGSQTAGGAGGSGDGGTADSGNRMTGGAGVNASNGGGGGGGGYFGGGGGRGDTNLSPGGESGGGGSGFIDNSYRVSIQVQNDTYTEYNRVGLTTTMTGTTSGTNTVTIPVASTINVGIGMTVTASDSSRIVLGSKIDSISRSTGAITLEHPSGSGDTNNSIGSGSVTFGRNIGESVTTVFATQPLEKFRRYRIRYRVFVPPGVTSVKGKERSINFLFQPPASISTTFLRYNNLYSLDYDFSDKAKGGINKFLEQSVLFGGNKDDGTERIGGTTQPEYVRISTDKKIDIKYKPKESLNSGSSKIERRTITGVSWDTGSTVLSIGDTTDIEVGNYIFGADLTDNIDTPVRVVDVVINKFILIDTPTNSVGSSETLTFIDHRGFVKRVTASGSSGTLSISNGSNTGIKKNQILIHSSAEKFTTITNITPSITYSPNATFGSRKVYIYESRGLLDQGLATFCDPGAFNSIQCFKSSAAVNSGLQTIPVESVTGLAIGMTVQGFPFASGTTIVSTNATAKTINLSAPTTKSIAADSQFTATTKSDDRTLCCPPTDTSPPFSPTEEGLQTNAGSSVNLRLNGGNLIFDNLTASMNSGNISALTPGATNNAPKRIQFKGGDGVIYDLLCE
tara:strand:+ start:3130 stop:6189 length:3060 start_codon:yes stop_codon:yes gene_type:complete